MSVSFIIESWHRGCVKSICWRLNEWNTQSRNTKVMQRKNSWPASQQAWLVSNSSSTTTVLMISSKPQFFSGPSIIKLSSMNDLKRFFKHWQYMRLRLMLSPKGEKLLKPAVCSGVWKAQHPQPTSSIRHTELCCQQPLNPLVYLIPPDEVPRINCRWAAEHFNESRA